MFNRKMYKAEFKLVKGNCTKEEEHTFWYHNDDKKAREWILRSVKYENPGFEVVSMDFKTLDWA